MKKFLMLLLLLLPLAIASCGDDKDEPTNTTNDPDNTMTVNLGYKKNTYISNEFFSYFYLTSSYNLFLDCGSIHTIGPVKGLGSIKADYNNISMWSEEVSAIVGYGYVLRSHIGNNGYHYMYLYIDSELIDTNGGVIGYRVKYLILN